MAFDPGERIFMCSCSTYLLSTYLVPGYFLLFAMFVISGNFLNLSEAWFYNPVKKVVIIPTKCSKE